MSGLFPFFDVGIDVLPRLFWVFDLVMTLKKSLKRGVWVLVPAPPLTSFVPLSKLIFFELQMPYL